MTTSARQFGPAPRDSELLPCIRKRQYSTLNLRAQERAGGARPLAMQSPQFAVQVPGVVQRTQQIDLSNSRPIQILRPRQQLGPYQISEGFEDNLSI
ncbi:hypothetical protein STEG23_014439 [Scotinomys teguina]